MGTPAEAIIDGNPVQSAIDGQREALELISNLTCTIPSCDAFHDAITRVMESGDVARQRSFTRTLQKAYQLAAGVPA